MSEVTGQSPLSAVNQESKFTSRRWFLQVSLVSVLSAWMAACGVKPAFESSSSPEDSNTFIANWSRRVATDQKFRESVIKEIPVEIFNSMVDMSYEEMPSIVDGARFTDTKKGSGFVLYENENLIYLVGAKHVMFPGNAMQSFSIKQPQFPGDPGFKYDVKEYRGDQKCERGNDDNPYAIYVIEKRLGEKTRFSQIPGIVPSDHQFRNRAVSKTLGSEEAAVATGWYLGKAVFTGSYGPIIDKRIGVNIPNLGYFLSESGPGGSGGICFTEDKLIEGLVMGGFSPKETERDMVAIKPIHPYLGKLISLLEKKYYNALPPEIKNSFPK